MHLLQYSEVYPYSMSYQGPQTTQENILKLSGQISQTANFYNMLLYEVYYFVTILFLVSLKIFSHTVETKNFFTTMIHFLQRNTRNVSIFIYISLKT